MKRIKRFILTFIALFIIFPCLTNAATELSASTQNPIVGDILYVQLEANYGKELRIRDLHLYIDYDPTYFELSTVKWVKTKREMGTTREESGKVYVDKTSGDWTSGPVLQLELKVLKAGSTRINMYETQKAYYTNGSPIAQTMAGIVINSVEPNSNTYLAKLYVKGYNMQPAFKKSLQTYNLTVPTDVSEIEIVANKYDVTQTVTGIGKKQLKYGQNRFRIVVTAQNQDSRTYEIMITRTDNRTGDLSLKTLQVTGTNIKAEANKTWPPRKWSSRPRWPPPRSRCWPAKSWPSCPSSALVWAWWTAFWSWSPLPRWATSACTGMSRPWSRWSITASSPTMSATGTCCCWIPCWPPAALPWLPSAS